MRADEIVIIVPSRGRPHAVEGLAQAWLDTGAKAQLHWSIDEDDPEGSAYIDTLVEHSQSFNFGPRLRLAGTLNATSWAYAHHYNAVGFMGDDHRPRTAGWDERFAECLSGGTGLVYGNDLLVGEKFPTAVVMTSDIIRKLGYMCPPDFVHLCLDLVWLDWGKGLDRITYLPDVVIEHMHPANGKAEMDDRYEEVNSTVMVSTDSAAYYAYRDNGGLDDDLAKLKELL